MTNFYKPDKEYGLPHGRKAKNWIGASKRTMTFTLKYLTENEHKTIDRIWTNHKTIRRRNQYRKQNGLCCLPCRCKKGD